MYGQDIVHQKEGKKKQNKKTKQKQINEQTKRQMYEGCQKMHGKPLSGMGMCINDGLFSCY